MTRTALYRHFDSAGSLLYVGISNDALRRLCQHKERSHWQPQIARVEVEWLPDREAALKAEADAIVSENPAWNIAGRNEPSRPPKSQSQDRLEATPGPSPWPEKDPSNPLVGMFFHTLKGGKVHYQGVVLSVDGDTALGQLFEWFMGEPSVVQAFSKSFLYSPECRLYSTREAWCDWAERNV